MWRLRVSALISALAALLAAPAAAPAGGVCPCSDAALCRPVQVEHEREVLGWGARGWTGYDWDTLTIVAHTDTPQMLCHAHKHNARVLTGARMWARDGNVSEMLNASARAAWVAASVAEVKERFLDGLYFDFEGPLSREQQPQLVSAFTDLVNETALALHAHVPGSKLVVATAWSPDDIDGRAYDYKGLAAAADYLFDMNYDTRSAIWGRCIASANAALSKASRGIQRYRDAGIDPSALILGLPWYCELQYKDPKWHFLWNCLLKMQR